MSEETITVNSELLKTLMENVKKSIVIEKEQDFVGMKWYFAEKDEVCEAFPTLRAHNTKRFRNTRIARDRLHQSIEFYYYSMQEEYTHFTDLEINLNLLTEKQFGQIGDYEIKVNKFLESYEHYQSLYTIFTFDKGNLPLIIVDAFEREQPGLTDGMPTTNSNFLVIGIKQPDDVVFRLL